MASYLQIFFLQNKYNEMNWMRWFIQGAFWGLTRNIVVYVKTDKYHQLLPSSSNFNFGKPTLSNNSWC